MGALELTMANWTKWAHTGGVTGNAIIGCEGGIRTHDHLGTSATCRFHAALDAKLATVAVDHCTLLHAGTTGNRLVVGFGGQRSIGRRPPERLCPSLTTIFY